MVFQNYALYPHMTVYDNMAFGLKLRKTPKDEIKRRVKRLLVSSTSPTCSTESRRLFPVVRDSVLLSAVLSSVTRRSSCSTSRSPTWTLSSVHR